MFFFIKGPTGMNTVNSPLCAVVDSATNIVVNVILADANVDAAPSGCFLVNLPDDTPISIGWLYDPATQTFTDPNPPPPSVVEEPTP